MRPGAKAAAGDGVEMSPDALESRRRRPEARGGRTHLGELTLLRAPALLSVQRVDRCVLDRAGVGPTVVLILLRGKRETGHYCQRLL